jgi:enoyl-CoA hydratase/carnithine racemase
VFDLTIDGAVATLRMCRPPVNAINSEWMTGFNGILDQIETAGTVSVLHIRSEEKTFCAGMDLAQVKALFDAEDGGDLMIAEVMRMQQLFARIEQSPTVVVAELGAAALGGGLELALACDLRIASHKAKIGLPEAGLGLIPGAGGTQRLTRLCGRGTASRIILSGEMIDGRTAEALGIVQWSFEPDALRESARAIVERIAGLAPPAVRAAKELIAAALDPARDGYREEREADRRLFDEAETRTRIANFFSASR